MEKETKDKLVRKVDNYSQNKKNVRLYSKYSRSELEKNTLIHEAEVRGIKEGITQGIEQGINQRNVEIAKKLLDKNIGIEDIKDITGLSIDDIKQIQELK